MDWIDDADSRVNIIAPPWPTCAASSGSAPGWPAVRSASPCWAAPPRGAAARRNGTDRRRPAGRGAGQPGGRFIAVGAASTAAFVLLYLLFRGVMTAQAANAASLLITAIANTAANRRFTFGIRGRAHAARHQLRGLIAFGVGLARHLRRAGRAARGHRPAGPGRRGHRARRWPTWPPPWSGSCSTGAGSSAARRPPRPSQPRSSRTGAPSDRHLNRGPARPRRGPRAGGRLGGPAAAGAARRPGVGPARAARPAGGDRAAVPGRPEPQRLGQRLLRRRGPGRRRRAGRRSCSARSTPPTSSPSTRPPPRCG